MNFLDDELAVAREGGSRRVQNAKLTIAICTLANMVDGFDVLAIAFTSSAIMREWQLEPATLGLLFSAGLAGMVLGSLLISPLADRIGRRPVALGCMAAMSVGMFGAAIADSAMVLMAFRFVTGLGIGGVLSTLNTVVAEVAPPHRRNMSMSILAIGYPLGSTLGGLVAVACIAALGWRSVFFIGGIATVAVLLLNWFFLPESRTKAAGGKRSTPYSALLSAKFRPATTFLCLAFFLHMICFFFVLNWTPRLVEMLGLSAEIGVTATIILNIGSLAGGLGYGLLADRLGWRAVGSSCFFAFAAFIAIFGFLPPSIPLIFALSALVGLAMSGAMTSLYALAPLLYPADLRASGTGMAISVGRIGATIGPALAGFAIGEGLDRTWLYGIFAVPPLLVALLMSRTAIQSHGGRPAQA